MVCDLGIDEGTNVAARAAGKIDAEPHGAGENADSLQLGNERLEISLRQLRALLDVKKDHQVAGKSPSERGERVELVFEATRGTHGVVGAPRERVLPRLKDQDRLDAVAAKDIELVRHHVVVGVVVADVPAPIDRR